MKLLSVFLAGLLAQDVLGRPSPDPKLHKGGRGGRGKRAVHQALKQHAETKREVNETASCTEAPATTIKAPKSNIWGQLTNDEAASVVAWLFAQEDLNLTTSEDAGAWDNTV